MFLSHTVALFFRSDDPADNGPVGDPLELLYDLAEAGRRGDQGLYVE